jgi:hypothetical protein
MVGKQEVIRKRRVHEGQIWVNNMELDFLLALVIGMKPMEVRNSGGMAFADTSSTNGLLPAGGPLIKS